MTMRQLRESGSAGAMPGPPDGSPPNGPAVPVPPPSFALTAVRIVPWAVTIGHAIWLGSLAFVDGAIALTLLMVPWVSLIGLSRRWQNRMRTKIGRIGLDLAVVTTCVLLVSFGGLWMLPGAVAFTALDVIEPGTVTARPRAFFVLLGAIILAALPGLLFAFVLWPTALLAALSLLVPPPETAALPEGRE